MLFNVATPLYKYYVADKSVKLIHVVCTVWLRNVSKKDLKTQHSFSTKFDTNEVQTSPIILFLCLWKINYCTK